MILAETQRRRRRVVPLSTLAMPGSMGASMERGLRELVFRYERWQDDFVVEPWIRVPVGGAPSAISASKLCMVRGDNAGKLGSYQVDPPIKDLDTDFDRLHFRSLSGGPREDPGLAGPARRAVRRHPAGAHAQQLLVDNRSDLDRH